MATTVISMKLPPNIDQTKQPLAYGDRCLPKLNEELHSNDLITRQRAIMSVCDLMHNPEHIAKAVKCGIVHSLGSLLKDSDAAVRSKSSEALCILAGHSNGREAMIKGNLLQSISLLFDDGIIDARRNAHHATKLCSQSPPGPEHIVDSLLIKTLVEKVKTDEDTIKEFALDTLHNCMRVDTDQALECNAMQCFTELLTNQSMTIRSKAARNIMDLSFPMAGKRSACAAGSVPQLVNLLSDDSRTVKASAAGALMSIAITTEGKYATIDAGAILPLTKLLSEETSEIRLNALKVITMIAESPKGRSLMQTHLSEVEKCCHDNESNAVRKAARLAQKTITWKP